ncbi:MAG TPA: aldose epimerase family protein [Clostridia bacterium]|nr:aldose epimerase family protein [Clostridia bacterium]
MSIEKNYYGSMNDGTKVHVYTLTNSSNMKVGIIDYGGIIVSLKVPGKNGKTADVVLGYDSLEQYMEGGFYLGALIGRHANRIEDAEFELNGKVYNLAKNDGRNHLHGGDKGFDKVVWHSEVINGPDGQALQLKYRSADGEENYPGNLDVKVIYTLTNANELKIDYYAVTDKDTVINLTNHSYFNLADYESGDILKHQLRINADKYTVINDEGIPTGEIKDVKGTPLDFTALTTIGKDIDSPDEQIVNGKGFDHNWILKVSGKKPEFAAEVYDPESGRRMEVYTTKPGIQFYSGNFLTSSKGKGGAEFDKRSGLCLETQFFPNAMKHKHFPSPVLKAGDEYRYTTIYKFL